MFYLVGPGFRTPFPALGMALGMAPGLLMIAVWYTLRQPWLGITTVAATNVVGLRVTVVHADGPAAGTLEEGDVVLGLGTRDSGILIFNNRDLLPDSDFLATFEQLNAFFERQGRFFSILAAPIVEIFSCDRAGVHRLDLFSRSTMAMGEGLPSLRSVSARAVAGIHSRPDYRPAQ